MTPGSSQSECPCEAPVLAALATATLDGDLLCHSLDCTACRETVAAWSCLQTLAASQADAPLPSAHFIWRKAQLAEQRRVAQRSIDIIQRFQKFALVTTVLLLLLCVGWFVPHLPLSVPPVCLLGVVVLLCLSPLTAASFRYSERHSARR